jgi:DNA primase
LADDRVKQVKEALDIVDVVGSYIALRPAGPTFKGLCPFHDDRRPSFDVDPRRQRYRCWSCGKYGDVLSFVQEFERVGFAEALELLARRAGIVLEKGPSSPHAQTRALMLETVRWASQQFHQCFLDDPVAEPARVYLGQRGLTGETVRRWLLGFAPATGSWLVQRARDAAVSRDILEKVGLIARRDNGQGHYDRFRDRVQFPIRDVRGQVVGFGGRILPDSPNATRTAKYYNSAETPLFNKSELLYGIDQARHAAASEGFLAVVEGYTDVLMAHQMGIATVVATMGTALNARHVQKLRQFAPRVILVYDADAGGDAGVDRALEIFASQDVDLAIATLPEGLDPCDLLVQQGPEPFRKVLASAVDALDFKLGRLLAAGQPRGVESTRRAVDAVLGIIALAPELPGQAGAVKTQLIVNRIAQRLSLKEETVWARLGELREARRREPGGNPRSRPADEEPEAPRQAPAAPEERELLEVLLAEPDLVAIAREKLPTSSVRHPGLRLLLEGLYTLSEEGEPPTLDQLRPRLENARLAEKALELQDIGKRQKDPVGWFHEILDRFRELEAERVQQELQHQLRGTADHAAALELLRQLQKRDIERTPGDTAPADVGS